ncbi:MAG TPA: DHA2 family efflux MFS transporter permease subunit, partial [Micromonosporaceae bacterium]
MHRKWWALGSLTLVSLVIGLDLMVLNVALPTLATSLHASTSDLQWFANAYSLVLAAALLPAGLLGDRYGRKRMLLGALALFGVASLACAYCQTVGELVAARALLGLGAAFLIPLTMSMVTVLFPPDERARAITVWVTANAIGIPLGPIVGGALLDRFWWGSVFLINVPVVVVAFAVGVVLLPSSRSTVRPRIDVAGVLTSSLGLIGLTYGVIRAGYDGWANGIAIASMVAGAVLFAAFVLIQLRSRKQPLVDVSLFGSPGFLWGSLSATLATFAMFGVFFAVPQFFQAVAGNDALATGLRLLPVIGGLLVGARVADRMARRVGAGILVAIGYALLAAGMFVGATTGARSGYGFVAGWLALAGLGMGFALPVAMNAALSALSAERSGVGSALIQAIRQVGGAIGVAILGTVLNSAYRDRVDVGHLPAAVAGTVRGGVSSGVAVAHGIPS